MKQRFCIGFEVHQPHRLKKEFRPDFSNDSEHSTERYFDDANKEILLRVCDKCYDPATSIILDQLTTGFAVPSPYQVSL